MKKHTLVHDSFSIKEKLEGKITDVIAALQELAEEYPDATIEVTTEHSYGDYSAVANLEFIRPQEPVEAEREMWATKADQLQALRTEAVAFERNGIAYPKSAEIEALRKELGFFAMAPKEATIRIYEGEVIVSDWNRGGRRRDGSWVYRMLSGYGELDAAFDKMDEQYRV